MGLLDAFKQYFKDAAPGGLLNPELTPQNIRTAGEYASMTPNPIGDVASGLLAIDDLRKGNYGDAALNGLGLLPFVPAMGLITKQADWPKTGQRLFNEEKVGKAKISFTVYPDIKEVDIASLRVPNSERRKGQARIAMNELLKEVDDAGYTAKLGASPLDKKTNLKKLVDFYRSLGFETTGKTINYAGDPEMVRPAR